MALPGYCKNTLNDLPTSNISAGVNYFVINENRWYNYNGSAWVVHNQTSMPVTDQQIQANPLINQLGLNYDSLSNLVNAHDVSINGLTANKQNNLISGTNIKTIQGYDLLGSGNVDILDINNIDLTSKQDNLVSGVNIKTVNGGNLLGSGDLIISGGGTIDLSVKQDTLISGTNIKTINGTSLLGTGDIVISSGSSGGNTTINYTELLLKFSGADQSTNFLDESKNRYACKSFGNPIISNEQSKFNETSLKLNGTNCLTFKINRDIINTFDDYTVEFWSYLPVLQSNQSVINFNSNYGGNGFSMRFANNTIGIDNTTTATVSSSSVLIANTWQHIAISKNNNDLYFYVNGLLIHQIAVQNYNEINVISIGRYGGGGVIDNFSGYLDNLRISSKAIYTPTLYPLGFNVPDDNFNVSALA